ncbi:MAG: MFS transporter, partial [Armatimonadetes bacterium]|nr:MFS transporter [Armatimonadota bacterium]
LPESARSAPDTLGTPLGSYARLIRRPAVWILLALRFFPTAYWGAVTFLAPLIIFRVAGKNTTVGDYQALALVMSAVTQVLSGRLCDRGYRRPVLLVAAAGITATTIGLAFTYQSLAGIYLFGIGGAGFAWMLSTTMPGIVRDLSTDAERSRLLAASHLAWSAGFVAGTLLAGQWHARPASVLWIVSACGALALGSVLLLLPFLRCTITTEIQSGAAATREGDLVR